MTVRSRHDQWVSYFFAFMIIDVRLKFADYTLAGTRLPLVEVHFAVLWTTGFKWMSTFFVDDQLMKYCLFA